MFAWLIWPKGHGGLGAIVAFDDGTLSRHMVVNATRQLIKIECWSSRYVHTCWCCKHSTSWKIEEKACGRNYEVINYNLGRCPQKDKLIYYRLYKPDQVQGVVPYSTQLEVNMWDLVGILTIDVSSPGIHQTRIRCEILNGLKKLCEYETIIYMNMNTRPLTSAVLEEKIIKKLN